jgi:uncharacterized Rossmann fold enzyme
MYCEELRELSVSLNKIGTPYNVVERIFKYPRHRETLSVGELSENINCDNICINIHLLKTSLRNKTICVLLPGIDSSELKIVNHCNEFIVAETALKIAIDLKIRPLAVVTDLDAPLNIITFYTEIPKMVIVHVHGDNVHKVKHFLRRDPSNALYTSQVEGLGCILGPLGFTDGDRAVIIPMLFESRKIFVLGYDLEQPKGKRFVHEDKMLKIGLGYLIIHYYAARLGYKIIQEGKALVINKE